MIKDEVNKLLLNLPPRVSDIDFYKTKSNFSTICYIQHIPCIVDEVFDKFVKLLILENIIPKRDYNSNFFSEKYSIIGRYIDDIKYDYDLTRHWYRYCCIDNNYCEWEQPYLVKLANSNPIEEFESIRSNYGQITKIININNSPDVIEYFRNFKIQEILK